MLTCRLAAVGLASWTRRVWPAETILVNGNVITVLDDAPPRARAVAMGRARILAVETDAEVRAHETAATRVVDVGGRRVVPAAGRQPLPLGRRRGGGAVSGAVVVTNSDWHEAQRAEPRLPLGVSFDL